MGSHRIQKSIFLADISVEKYEAIKRDLAEVQSLYENHDSIIVCPGSSDLIRSMKVIGKVINLDVITHTKNTLVFFFCLASALFEILYIFCNFAAA